MHSYKIWLYSVNLFLLVLEIFLLVIAIKFFTDPWIEVFPISEQDIIPQIYAALMGFQITACICGLVGTYTTRIPILKIFWILMISLVIIDVCMINPMANWMSTVHKDFSLEKIALDKEVNCSVWKDITRKINCCPPTKIAGKCRNIGYYLPRCSSSVISCTRPLLQWLHMRADHAALTIYFLLLPLKCLVVFVLREDIRRIFFIQEVSGDYDEAEDEYTPTYKEFKEVSPLKEVKSVPQRLYGA